MNKEKFYNLLKPLVSIYDDIEKDLILDILERIDNYDGQKGTLKWYLDKLNELKVFEKYGTSITNKKKKEIKQILEEILETSVKNSVSIDTLESYNSHNNANISVNDIFNSRSANNLISEALKDTENISKLINTKAIESAKKEYQDILNTAYLEASTGIYTYDKSIRLAIDKMAQNGILMANYDSGRRISIESAVRRDIITRVNKLVGDIELTTAKDIMKTNLVYVDQHLGARTRTKYTKEDFEAHDEWQGKIYMIEGSNDKYGNLYEKTGYGKMLGLKGINCYHDLRPYFEWETIPKPIDIEESKKERALLDTQREFERNIRALKRKKIVAKKMGYEETYEKANKSLIKINKEYNKWLEENQKIRNANREYVSNKANVLNTKNKEEAKKNLSFKNNEKNENLVSNYEDVTAEWFNNATPNSNQVKDRDYFDYDGVRYKVDGKNVVLDYSPGEKELAEWLENTFGGDIYMIPRINNPDGIQTADYLFKGEYWDLKTLTGSGKRILEDSIKRKRRQASNFIFDVTNSKIEENNLFGQLRKMYNSKSTNWVDKIIVKKDKNVIVIYKRNKKD